MSQGDTVWKAAARGGSLTELAKLAGYTVLEIAGRAGSAELVPSAQGRGLIAAVRHNANKKSGFVSIDAADDASSSSSKRMPASAPASTSTPTPADSSLISPKMRGVPPTSGWRTPIFGIADRAPR